MMHGPMNIRCNFVVKLDLIFYIENILSNIIFKPELMLIAAVWAIALVRGCELLLKL